MTIYVDGSCSKNGANENIGGFGAVVIDENNEISLLYQEREENTTNNRQELKAILWAMKNYGQPISGFAFIPIVYSDSAYSVSTFNEWMFNWERRGWIKADKKIPENLDIIQEYFDLFKQGYRIDLRKCAGHQGVEYNELADKLAKGEKVIGYDKYR